MDFLDKLNFLLKSNNLNKNTLSKLSGIPYTTIDGWYKKGFESMQLSTLKKLAKFFNTNLDFWADDFISTSNIEVNDNFKLEPLEIEYIKKYRELDIFGKKIVDTIIDMEHDRCSTMRYDINDTYNNMEDKLKKYDKLADEIAKKSETEGNKNSKIG